MILLQLLFSYALLISGPFFIKWAFKRGPQWWNRWDMAGYKVLIGIHNIAVGTLCLIGVADELRTYLFP